MTPKQAEGLFLYAVASTVAAELDANTAKLWQRHLMALDYADAEPALRAWVAGHRWCNSLAELLAACGLGDVADERGGRPPSAAHAMCADAARLGWRLSRADGVPDPGEDRPRAGWLVWDPAKPPPYTVRLARVVAGRPEYEQGELHLDRLALRAPSTEEPKPPTRTACPPDVAASIRESLAKIDARHVPAVDLAKPAHAAHVEAALAQADAAWAAALAEAEADLRESRRRDEEFRKELEHAKPRAKEAQS